MLCKNWKIDYSNIAKIWFVESECSNLNYFISLSFQRTSTTLVSKFKLGYVLSKIEKVCYKRPCFFCWSKADTFSKTHGMYLTFSLLISFNFLVIKLLKDFLFLCQMHAVVLCSIVSLVYQITMGDNTTQPHKSRRNLARLFFIKCSMFGYDNHITNDMSSKSFHVI